MQINHLIPLYHSVSNVSPLQEVNKGEEFSMDMDSQWVCRLLQLVLEASVLECHMLWLLHKSTKKTSSD